MEDRQDRMQEPERANVRGIKIHSLFKTVLRKRSDIKASNWTDEEWQILKVVEEIEKQFQLNIVCSEKPIGGFSTDSKRQEGPYYWRGKIDAIGLMNGNDKDGCGVVVLDWRTCSRTSTFWEKASQYKAKLHQCLIYRRLLAVHMREYFEDPKMPEPGIMIVPLDADNVQDNDPRLCMDFTTLEKAGILKKLDQFKWDANSFSQNESAEGHKKAIPMVRSLLLVRSVN